MPHPSEVRVNVRVQTTGMATGGTWILLILKTCALVDPEKLLMLQKELWWNILLRTIKQVSGSGLVTSDQYRSSKTATETTTQMLPLS